MFAAGLLAFCLALCLPLVAPGLATLNQEEPVQLSLAAAGLLLAVIGLAIATWARITLGASWTTAPKADATRELATSGPFARVRHPVYLGMFLALAGDAMVFANWVAFLIGLVWALPAMLWRARVEEHLLVDVYGEQYLRYRQGTKRFLPWLW
jgi:protein-S-isoprenylcysteine O-methyltransferase Ste14